MSRDSLAILVPYSNSIDVISHGSNLIVRSDNNRSQLVRNSPIFPSINLFANIGRDVGKDDDRSVLLFQDKVQSQ